MQGVPASVAPERVTGHGMNRRTASRVVFALPALAGLQMASAQRDGRGNRFDDDLFARLEGKWTLTRHVRGTRIQSSVSATWVLQHQVLLLRMRDVATPQRYEADVYIGYSYAANKYVAHWIDNVGGHFSRVGWGRRSGNTVAFRQSARPVHRASPGDA
jgi:hypothetical protein